MYQAETKTVSISGSFLFDIEIEFVAKFFYFLCKYWQSHTNGICNLVNLAKIILRKFNYAVNDKLFLGKINFVNWQVSAIPSLTLIYSPYPK